MKKIAFVLVGILLLAGVSMGMITLLDLSDWHGECSSSDTDFKFNTRFRGQMVFRDQNGTRLGDFDHLNGDENAPVNIDAAGEHFSVSGFGLHEIRSRSGKLIGSVKLNPLSKQDIFKSMQELNEIMNIPTDLTSAAKWAKAKEIRSNMGSDTSGGPPADHWGCVSWDHVYWFVRGHASIDMIDTRTGDTVMSCSDNGLLPDQKISALPLFAQAPFKRSVPNVPQIAITVDDKITLLNGYAKYPISNSAGKLIYYLDVKPITSQPGAFHVSSPAGGVANDGHQL